MVGNFWWDKGLSDFYRHLSLYVNQDGYRQFIYPGGQRTPHSVAFHCTEIWKLLGNNSFDNSEINYHHVVVRRKLIFFLSIVEIPRIIRITNARHSSPLAVHTIWAIPLRPILLFAYCLALGTPNIWFSSTFDKWYLHKHLKLFSFLLQSSPI